MKYIGDKKFYTKVLAIAIPIIIQNGISSFVNLLDNVMVGQLGTEAMSAVSIANQLLTVFIILIFGVVSGAGIFAAQYHGSEDTDGLRSIFRFKLLSVFATTVVSILIFIFFDDQLISLFLHESNSDGSIEMTLALGKEYLLIMLFGLVPVAATQIYASTLRETASTVPPMIASIAAIFTNLILNYILIFGHLGLPAMGVKGAAIATVISRYIEALYLIVWTHLNPKKCPYIKGGFRSFYVPKDIVYRIFLSGLPIALNELFWSLGITFMSQSYSMRGLDVVAALNVAGTISNLFAIVYLSIGNSISIITGNLLGAEKLEEAKDTNRKLITFSVMSATVTGIILAALSGIIPKLYNMSTDVRALATFMLLTVAILAPFSAFAHASYFTLRSGGKVFVTILLDSGYMWAISIPLSFILSRFTPLSIFLMYPICQGTDILKATFGAILLKKVNWAQSLVAKKDTTQ
ncbi:MAG: MATE family efflux transporter [Clostridia bacterium]|nr:MATE family efflux transporter [Clostridia bacterium]